MIARLCRFALVLYPEGWRSRYGDELGALLEDGACSLRTLADLLLGALDAHISAAGPASSPTARMRGALAATACSWIALALFGAGFAKATEDVPFRELGTAHPALADARLAVLALALAGCAVIALAGAPLVFTVLRQAWRERTPAVVAALRWALASAIALIGVTGALIVFAHAQRGPSPLGNVLLVVWGGVVVSGAVASALAVRAALVATRFDPWPLVIGVVGAWLLSRIMSALTVAVALYAALLMIGSSSLAASPNGPLHLSTSVVLVAVALGMALASATALVSTRRGMRALRGR